MYRYKGVQQEENETVVKETESTGDWKLNGINEDLFHLLNSRYKIRNKDGET